MTKKAFVIGNNVHKSLSPTIFNYWFKKYNVDGEYDFIEIKEKDFEKKITKIFAIPGMCGLNITIPFKEKIIPFVSNIDSHSNIIGAINCVTKKQKNFIGSNTDWLGFKNSINWIEGHNTKNSITIKNKNAAVIGYGGSAKAIIYALEKMNYNKVYVWNRTFNKIKNLKKLGSLKIQTEKLETKKIIIKNNTDLVVNTIPSNKIYSLYGLDFPLNNKKQIFGYDLVYNIQTDFLDMFIPPNQINGINLLIHQAAPCFAKWFKIKPEIDEGLIKLLLKKIKNTK